MHLKSNENLFQFAAEVVTRVAGSLGAGHTRTISMAGLNGANLTLEIDKTADDLKMRKLRPQH